MRPALSIIANALLIGGVLTAAAVMPASGGPVAVVVAPWSERADAVAVVAAAGGSLVGTGRWSWIAVARADDAGLPDRLYAAGAALVFDSRLAAFCTTP